jgi:anti-anti-sigma regulatory factor
VKEFSLKKKVIIDFAGVHYVDHTSMAALVDLKHDQAASGTGIEMRNIDILKPYSSHPAAARGGPL